MLTNQDVLESFPCPLKDVTLRYQSSVCSHQHHGRLGSEDLDAKPFLGRRGVCVTLSPGSSPSGCGTHTKLRMMAPAKPTSRKKGREPRMDVMTIMPPLRRPGHVSMAE